MKKSLLVAAVAALSSFGAFAQGYYIIKSKGVDASAYDALSTSGTTIIAASSTAQTGVLSSAQTLPFAFNFYGNPVNQFKVSTSGYLTFNTGLSTDVAANVALPSASAPIASIFPFWDNLRLQSVSGSSLPQGIRSWTYGTAPNRVFVVQWQFVQLNDNSTSVTNANYFAIRFYENGGGNTFDCVQNFGLGTFTATIGCQNLTADAATQVSGSPNLNFGGAENSYDPASCDVYTFNYGVQKAIDLRLVKSRTPEIVGVANANGISVKLDVLNYGSTDVISAKMNYSVNGGAAVTGSVTGNITNSGGSGAFTHPTTFKGVIGDVNTTKTLKVWFTEINGGSEKSDSFTVDVFVNKGITGTKKVLIEEGSGAWCGYCPDGHYRLKDILANNENVIGVVHHNSDGMVNGESNTFNSTYATGYPYGTVDRVKFDDIDEVGMNRGEWAGKAAVQLNAPAPVNVTIIDKTFDWVSRTVSYKVKVDFVDYAKPGDLRINTMVIEDKVRGPKIGATSTQWNQRNYYSYEAGNQAGGSGHPLFGEPAYIVGYWHNEVVRAIPSGVWGTQSVITNPAEGQSYEQTYSYQLPAANALTYGMTEDDTEFRSTKDGLGWNKYDDTRIVAFVSYYNADVNKRQVLNATEAPMLTTGVKETAQNNVGNVSVYPNPANGLTSVTFDLKSGSKADIEVVNVLGQKVTSVASSSYAAGEHTVYFNAADMNNGIYFVNVTTAEGKATYRFVVSK